MTVVEFLMQTGATPVPPEAFDISALVRAIIAAVIAAIIAAILGMKG